MQASIKLEGEHLELASQDEITAGLNAARDVFSRHNADPLACAAANEKWARDELLSREEAQMCVIWGTADETAFRAVTLGWLSRDIDIRLAVG
ncbi:MAG: hypothetical protein K8F27_12090 [Sulfuricellaceae bacterium]|nr:hypothetical protein [Sulfuricellaceae bacterium]